MSANRPVPDDLESAGNSGKPAEANSQGPAAHGSQKKPAPLTVEAPVLSAKERVKQALLKLQRDQEASVEPVSPSVAEFADSNSAPPGNTSNPQQVPSPSPVEAVEIEDPIERAKAARFLFLKSQLQQLKSKLQTSPAGAPPRDGIPSAAAGSDAASLARLLHIPKAGEQSDETHAASGQPANHGTHSRVRHPEETDSTNGSLPQPASHDPGSRRTEHPPRTDHSLEAPRQEAEKHSVDTTHELPSALPQHAVVDGPIDRLGLANNLFAVGEYLLAKEMYEQADPAEMTAQQQIWTEYQIANCLRRTGRKAEASGRYRRLAAQPETGWLSGQSRWWVDVLEQTRQLEKALAEDGTSTSTPAKASESQHSTHSDPKAKESKHGEPAH